jgi:hypothetical protein
MHSPSISFFSYVGEPSSHPRLYALCTTMDQLSQLFQLKLLLSPYFYHIVCFKNVYTHLSNITVKNAFCSTQILLPWFTLCFKRYGWKFHNLCSKIKLVNNNFSWLVMFVIKNISFVVSPNVSAESLSCINLLNTFYEPVHIEFTVCSNIKCFHEIHRHKMTLFT